MLNCYNLYGLKTENVFAETEFSAVMRIGILLALGFRLAVKGRLGRFELCLGFQSFWTKSNIVINMLILK